jgi:hypothetical protein
MTRFGLLTFCMILGAAPLGCSSSGGNGGEGGSGTGGSTVGTGGNVVGTGGSTVGSGGAAGTTGTQSKSAIDVVMRDNQVAGWTLDPDNPKTKGKVAATATNAIDAEYLIDGSAADFFRTFTPKMFAWQTYVSSTVPDAPEGAMASLYILEMASAADASGLYAYLPSDANVGTLYRRKRGTPDDWTEPASATLGTSSRIQNSGTTWWINFCKGNFYIELDFTPSQGPAPDYNPGDENTKKEAFRFAQAISDKI